MFEPQAASQVLSNHRATGKRSSDAPLTRQPVKADPETEASPSFGRGVFAWGFVAQIFSSATNFGLTLLAGRLLGPGGLGIVVLGFGAYQLVAGLQRALVTQPIIADAAPLVGDKRRQLADSGLSVVAWSGIAATLVVIAVGAGVGSAAGRGVLVFAPWMVVALLQDYWKAILFQEGRGSAGAASDFIRFAVAALMVPVAVVWTKDYIVVAGWGLGAAAGLAIALWSFPGHPPRPSAAFVAWRQRAWGLGRWLGAREIVFQIFAYSTILILALILGTDGLGGLRSAEALFSPFSLVAAALVLPALPALSRAAAYSHARALDLAFRMCAVAVGFGLTYMLVMAFIGPWLLVYLFGQPFSPFTDLVWPMAAVQVLNAAGVSFTLLLSAENRGPASLIAGVAYSAATTIFAAVCALFYGVSGAAWGMAIGASIGSVAVVYLALRGRKP